MNFEEQAKLIDGLKELQSRVNALAGAQLELKALLLEVIRTNKALIERQIERDERHPPQFGT
ncbi:MAG TPA: hypothetical protein VMV10_11820 [Pirellulales bacterium]|nr:hypothetical protein [Pirellulales bacterium]